VATNFLTSSILGWLCHW